MSRHWRLYTGVRKVQWRGELPRWIRRAALWYVAFPSLILALSSLIIFICYDKEAQIYRQFSTTARRCLWQSVDNGWPRCVILRQIRSTSKSLLYVLLKSPGLLQFPLIHWYTVRHDGYFIQRHAVITKCACMQVAVNTSAQFWGNFSGWLFNFNLCQTTSILAQFRVLKEPLNWWIWISTD